MYIKGLQFAFLSYPSFFTSNFVSKNFTAIKIFSTIVNISKKTPKLYKTILLENWMQLLLT